MGFSITVIRKVTASSALLLLLGYSWKGGWDGADTFFPRAPQLTLILSLGENRKQ